jgi:hypothetical protein
MQRQKYACSCVRRPDNPSKSKSDSRPCERRSGSECSGWGPPNPTVELDPLGFCNRFAAYCSWIDRHDCPLSLCISKYIRQEAMLSSNLYTDFGSFAGTIIWTGYRCSWLTTALVTTYSPIYTLRMRLAKIIMRKAKKLFEKSGMTMEELAQKMGNDSATGRQYVWQLFNKTDDPRISTIEKLAEALGVEVKDLL